MSDPLPRHPLSRYAARFSIVAPIAAFWMMCLALGGLGEGYQTSLGGWLHLIVELLLLLLIVAGLALGGYALVRARREASRETQALAVLGLVLNLGWVLLWTTLLVVALLY
ncbi:MAG: hypothetical protein RIC55_04390 [Pirellulaceae bacterium]